MASISTYYIWVGKSLKYNGSTAYTIYWRDFNPRQTDIPDPPSDWDRNTVRASGETSYNLSWFQCGNEVCFCTYTLHFVWLRNTTMTVVMRFQKYVSWRVDAGWEDAYTTSYDSDDWISRHWYYVWIDSDEIWDDATQYRFLIQVSGGWLEESFTAPFSVSWLSFDSSLHPAGYLWVQWTQLCYTDASYSSSRWYKHIINMDGSYSATNVWSDKAWYIRLPDSTNDNHIYYVDANWYTRRTKESQTRFDSSEASAWSSKAWYIWVSSAYWAENWYAHLCYVNNAGLKRRIITWWV